MFILTTVVKGLSFAIHGYCLERVARVTISAAAPTTAARSRLTEQSSIFCSTVRHRQPFPTSLVSTRTARSLMRYYFDMREGESLALDDEGLELPSLAAAEHEAALSLADIN
jgi:hypothetical protein